MLDEMIYNWSNSLQKSASGKNIVLAKRAHDMKEQGYSALDAYDILVADFRGSSPLVEAAINTAYEDTLPLEPKTRTACVVPTRYEDVEPFITEAVHSHEPRAFVSMLTGGEYPVVNAPRRTRDTIALYAAKAADGDRTALARVHDEIRPWIENAIRESIFEAEYINGKGNVTVEADRDSGSHYKVAVSSGKLSRQAQVSLDDATCSCQRFQKGSYEKLGLACEHLVLAADSVSPTENLMRAVTSR